MSDIFAGFPPNGFSILNGIKMIIRNTGVENWTDAPKIKIGICAMGKKTTSKECIINHGIMDGPDGRHLDGMSPFN